MKTSTIKIIIADDHTMMREGLRSLIEKQPDMITIAEADNGRKTLKLVQELKPDIVLMDVSMPDLNGIEATHQIKKEIPFVKVIALSMHSEKLFVSEMLKAGASGYLLKQCAFKELDLVAQLLIPKGHEFVLTASGIAQLSNHGVQHPVLSADAFQIR
jgi:DNA-binding NarL/FixJ family response regulator